MNTMGGQHWLIYGLMLEAYSTVNNDLVGTFRDQLSLLDQVQDLVVNVKEMQPEKIKPYVRETLYNIKDKLTEFYNPLNPAVKCSKIM